MAIEIVDFPIQNGDFPWQNVSSPDGIKALNQLTDAEVWGESWRLSRAADLYSLPHRQKVMEEGWSRGALGAVLTAHVDTFLQGMINH